MIGFPFDSHVTFDSDGTPQYDRAISSEPYRKLIKSLFSTGVLPNPSTNLQVVEGEDLTVVVHAGFCVVEGCMKLEETDRALIVQAGASMDRIDSVVMRLNDNDAVRSCDLYVVQGAPGSDPVHPELTRTTSIYEIALADIFVPANSTNVAQYRITDTRYDATRCGIVSSVSEFDTSTIFLQLQAEFERFRTVNEAQFNDWFSHLQDILDADTAGHLQNEIVALQNTTNQLRTDLDELDASEVTYNDGTVKSTLDDLSIPLVRVERVNISKVSVASGGGQTATHQLPVINGYNPVGVVGYYLTGDRASAITMPNLYINNGVLTVYYKNNTNATVSLTTSSYYDILYIRG